MNQPAPLRAGRGDCPRPKEPPKSKFKAKEPKRVPPSVGGGFGAVAASEAPSEGLKVEA